MNSSSFCFYDFRTDIKYIYCILMDQIGRGHLRKNLSFLEFWNLAFIWKTVEWESHKVCRV